MARDEPSMLPTISGMLCFLQQSIIVSASVRPPHLSSLMLTMP